MAVLSAPTDVIASRKKLSGFYLRPAVFAVEMVTEFRTIELLPLDRTEARFRPFSEAGCR
jgi:hypothetical protein